MLIALAVLASGVCVLAQTDFVLLGGGPERAAMPATTSAPTERLAATECGTTMEPTAHINIRESAMPRTISSASTTSIR